MQAADKSAKPSTSNSSGKGLKIDLLARQNEMNDLISLYYAISKKRRHSKMSRDDFEASHAECVSAGSCSESDYSVNSANDEERIRKTPLKKRPIQHSGVLQDVRRITLGCAKSYVPEDDAIPEKQSSPKPKKSVKKEFPEAGTSSGRNGISGLKEITRAKLAAKKEKAKTAKMSRASMAGKVGSKQEMDDHAFARKLHAQMNNLRERASTEKADA